MAERTKLKSALLSSQQTARRRKAAEVEVLQEGQQALRDRNLALEGRLSPAPAKTSFLLMGMVGTVNWYKVKKGCGFVNCKGTSEYLRPPYSRHDAQHREDVTERKLGRGS